MDMPTELEAVEASLLIAADEMIKAGAMAPATTGPIWNDSDKKAMLELLQGSLLKFSRMAAETTRTGSSPSALMLWAGQRLRRSGTIRPVVER